MEVKIPVDDERPEGGPGRDCPGGTTRSQNIRGETLQITESERRFREMANNAPVMIWITQPDGACTFLSESWYRFTGQSLEESLGLGWVNAVHPDDRQETKAAFTTANERKAPFRVEYRLRRHDGEYRWALDSAQPRLGEAGEYLGYIGSVVDITERKKAERLEAGQREVMELIATDAPLPTIFNALIRMVEEQSPTRVLASILIAEDNGKRLRHGAAPSLPEAYNACIDGIETGPEVGSCGTAAYHRKPVYVSDISASPLWRNFAALAESHGLRACWSTPILSNGGELLGTFALYYQSVREPNDEDLHIVSVATRTAAIAIERQKTESTLRRVREESERQRRLYETILSSIPDLVYVFDLNHRFTYANDALLKMWGRKWDEAIGKNCLELGYEPWHAEMHGREIDTVFATRRPIRGEVPFVGSNGRRIYDYIFVPVFGPGGDVIAVAGSTRDVTERKQAEEALLLAQTRLDATLTAAEIATWNWDIPNNRMHGDKNAARIFGLTEAEAAHGPVESYAKRVHPDDWPSVELAVAKALKSGTYEMEYRVIRPDSSTIHVVARGKVDYNDRGEPVRFPGVIIDITEARRAQEALRLSRERLNLVIDASKVGVWFCDLPFHDLDWDARVKEHFWLEPNEKVTIDLFFERLHPEDRAKARLAIDAAIQRGVPYDIEYRTVSPAGEVRWVRAIGRAFLDQNGKANRFDGVTIDISADKKREADLREAAERLRFMAESMPQKIFTADPQGEVTYLNRQWGDFTGCATADLLGSRWTERLHPDDREATVRRWKQCVGTGESFQMEHRFQRADSTWRWHLTRAHAMRDPRGNVIVWIGSNTDIDDQKRAEAHLEETVNDRTAKLTATIAELEAFSYSVSHDLRSPLRAMQGYSEELLQRLSTTLAPDNRQFLERIHRAASRLDRLTQEVLAYSRLSRAEITLQPIDFDRLIPEILEQYPNLQAKLESFTLQTPLGICIGHEAFLTQAVSNLLNNAVKFVRPNVPLNVNIRTESSGPNIRLWIEDNGIGIEPRHSKRLFQMFGKIHPDTKYEGTGIGLAVVKKSVERMNGAVGFDSVPGAGSRFWIELPAISN